MSELRGDRVCQLLVTSPEIPSLRLKTREKNGVVQATEIALSVSGACVRLDDSHGTEPRMRELQAQGLCTVAVGVQQEAAELSLESELTGRRTNQRSVLFDLPPAASAIGKVHTFRAVPRDGMALSWTQVDYSLPAAPLHLGLMACHAFYCLGPSAWAREQHTLNEFDDVSLVRQLLSLVPTPDDMDAQRLALMVVESPREDFTAEQVEILGQWAAPGKRSSGGAPLTEIDARIVADLLGDSRFDDRVARYIQSVLRAYPELVDLHFATLLEAASRSQSEGRSPLDVAMLGASQPVLESHRSAIETYLASLGSDPSLPILGLAGRLGRDLTEEVAKSIAADRLRAAILLACFSAPPMSAELAGLIAGLIPEGTGSDARYALQALAIRDQLEIGVEAAVAAGKVTRDWIERARYEQHSGDVRMCLNPG